MTEAHIDTPPIVEDPEPELWAKVEILGHRKHWGRVSEVVCCGITLIRVDEPAGDIMHSHLYCAAAIFSIHPMSEDRARFKASMNRRAPDRPLAEVPPLLAAAVACSLCETEYPKGFMRKLADGRELCPECVEDVADHPLITGAPAPAPYPIVDDVGSGP